MKRLLAPWFLASALVAGCTPAPLTQLVIAVDTDLSIPGDLDRIEVTVTEPDGSTESRSTVLAGAGNLPVSLGVVHRGGPLGPVTIEARAILGSATILARNASVTMIEGRTMLLTLHLESACIGVACEGEAVTCERGLCRAVAIEPGELVEYEGTVPRLDVDGGTSCLRTELCNGRDDTCDGMIDEDFDLDSDPENCGGCGNACPAFENSRPACVGGECAIACEESFGDCDGEIRTGCEQSLASLSMCGECGEQCSTPHATPSCFDTTCSVASCAAGYGDCDGLPGNGCEMLLNRLEDCGACGRACAPTNAVGSCGGGLCSVVGCMDGFDDCTAADGCETRLGTLANCGSCNDDCPTPANATAACNSGRCGIESCTTGFGDCNAMVFDGCERRLDTTTHCGACDRACILPHALPRCTAGECAIMACEPGFGDCDGRADTGCETSLEDSAHCGSCTRSCSGATPVCNELGTGERVCESVCGAVLELCGSSCVDTDRSLLHCGMCDRACDPPHANGTCSGGACGIASCDAGWDDCDGLASNGCETSLSTMGNCGACGRTCALPGATAMCVSGSCAVASCNAMRDDCDGMASNGCETRLDTLTDCGSCRTACTRAHATATCGSGTCDIATCATGFSDCDGMSLNGCETPLDSLTDCGSCDVACELPNAVESCATRTCAVSSCDPSWGDCGAGAGCETSLETLSNCGACGVACGPFPNAQATCATGDCAMVCDEDFGDCSAAPGCETSLETLTDCGACGMACAAPGASTSCSTGSCVITACDDAAHQDCNGSYWDGCEIDTTTDTMNCGACGMPCADMETCIDSVCTAP